MNTKHRPLGIEGLGDMSWGTHFCSRLDELYRGLLQSDLQPTLI